jgi:hypothetical protein
MADNENFQKILHLILIVGNILNFGKASGNAKGYKLDVKKFFFQVEIFFSLKVLLKLGDTKNSRTARKNLFHFVTEFVRENSAKFPEFFEKIQVNQERAEVAAKSRIIIIIFFFLQFFSALQRNFPEISKSETKV